MLFSSRSIQFKIALGLLWVFPYVGVLFRAPKWKLFARNLVESGLSFFLFAMSSLLLGLLVTNFDLLGQERWPLRMLENAIFAIVFVLPGLPLILLFGGVTAVLKPEFPNNLILYFLSGLSHLLYCFNIIVVEFELDEF